MANEGTRPGGFAVVATRIAGLWVLVGAFLKLFLGTPEDLPEIVRNLPPDVGLTFRVAIAAELAVGFLALLKPRWSWLLVLTMLLVFDVALVTQIQAGVPSCGCFGSKVVVPPAVVLGIDTLLVLLILVGRPWTALGRDGIHALAIVMLLAVAVPLPWLLDREAKGANGSVAFGRPWKALEVGKWPGLRLADTGLGAWVDLSALPANGVWVVYVESCEVCAKLLEWMKLVEQGDRPVVLLRLPLPPDEERHVHDKPEGSWVHEVDLPDTVDWGITPPGMFVVKDGCVIWGEAPSSDESHEFTLNPPANEACESPPPPDDGGK